MKQSKTSFMKRWLIALSLFMTLGLSAFADKVEFNGLYYNLNTEDRTASVTYENTGDSNYSSLQSDVVIPEKVTSNNVEFTVTSIENAAFANCKTIESISIPASIIQVGQTVDYSSTSSSATYYYGNAGKTLPFYNCSNLKKVRIEDGNTLLYLGVNRVTNSSYSANSKNLFAYCPLEEVYIGRNILNNSSASLGFTQASYSNPEYYRYSPFYPHFTNTKTLKKVVIGEGVTTLRSYMFYLCTTLNNVEFNNSIKSIPAYTFYGCSNLSSANLPETVLSIEEYAFYNCSSLKEANIGSSSLIGDHAFYGTSSLQSINFTSAISTINSYAFYGSGIKSLNLPTTVKFIGNNAFNSSKIETLVFGDSNIELGTSVFANCTDLSKVEIGDGLEEITNYTFENCSSLSEIKLGSNVSTIGNGVFSNCTSLESITIPQSVNQLGTTIDYSSTSSSDTYYYGNAGILLPFYNCTNLKTVLFEDGENPIFLGVARVSNSSYNNYAKGLFYYCPLENIYLGRNIMYKTSASTGYHSGTYSLESYPQYYGYSSFYNQSKLAKISIGEQVTTIQSYLFYKNAAITLMTLPHVKIIGKSAFESCSKLTTLNLGDAIETVDERAFYMDSNITKLTFPNTTKSIGSSAFRECTSVTEITVGSGLESIDSYAFYGNNSFTALILPDGFTTMGESAFEGCTKLTVAKLGENLTAVPAKAFKNCTSLSEMVIPATAESIGDQAFYNDSGIATITMKEGLKTIGNEVFWNNSGIMTFTIPGTVTTIGTNCFYGCTRVMYLTFSDGEEILTINNSNCKSSKIDAITSNTNYINRYYDYFYDCPIRFLTLGRNLSYSYKDSQSMYDVEGTSFKSVTRATAPFYNSTELRSVTIGPKVTYLNNHLFDNCKNLSIVSMNETLRTVYSYAFNECDALSSMSYPATLSSLGSYSMANCDILKSVTYQEASDHSLSINDYTFYNCPVLTSQIFPGQLSKLGNNTYENCSSLSEVIFNENDTYKPTLTIGNYTFAFCDKINTLTFPGRLSSIGNYTFKRCDYLTEVSFLDSPTAVTLGYGAAADGASNNASNKPLFGNSNLEKLYLGRNIEYDATSLYGYSPFYNQTFLTDVKFSQAGTVTYCKKFLLYYVTGCEELILPESLTDIGSYTFARMQKLKGITIPNKVTTMGTYAFAYDTDLQFVNLSTTCAWLQKGIFSRCSALEAITIPPVVTKMDASIFDDCKSLTEAIFESNSELLEINCDFRTCPLETLYLDRWLSYSTTSTSSSPFYGIKELKNLTFGDNVQVIDKYMFSYCTGLEELVLPDNITSIGLWGFRGCSSLKKVKFSQKLSQVSDYGFSECSSLDNVVFPASMTSIADNSFSNCTSLKTLDLGSSLLIIGPSAFMNDSALEGFEIPETLYGLGVEAFKGCTSLPNVTIRSISSVGARAFQDCIGIKWISLSDKTTSLGEDSFAGCSGINYVKSYATYPPEGLVNFVEGIPENGTLFVPQASIMYYQISPTWEDWLDIRALNENIMVSNISLNKNEISFKATETENLTATVGNDDATDKGVLWRTSDESIVTVDNSGTVTAIGVGEATITALAADGSGVKDECHVTVLPTMVEDIAIIGSSNTLKKGRTLELTASVLPITATNNNVIWSTSDNKIANVNEEGIVTAIAAGQVQITATAEDGSTKFGTFDLTVIPPTLGDSNDNDEVTITDAVNTANFAIGNPVDNFNQEAADVNGDNRITLADASGTVTIILEQPAETSVALMKAKALMAENNADFLVVENFAVKAGQSVCVPVMLDNTVDYVAIQADITVPKGMKIESVTIGNRAEVNHSLLTKRIDDNTVRIVLFDLSNSEFADNNDSLFNINVISNEVLRGEIVIGNIIASDATANEYRLYSTGGNFSDMSGVDNIHTSNVRIETAENAINVFNAENQEVAVFATDGTTIARFVAKTNSETINVVPGIYVISAGDNAVKVIVK